MAQALLLVGLPLGVATLVYLLRRVWAGAMIAALITLLLTWLTVRLPTGVVFNLLGRTIELDELSQVTLFLLFAATAGLFLMLILLTLPHYQDRRLAGALYRRKQEARIFYPAALVILALFGAASLSRHLGITAIFVELAAILMVFVIQTERLESTRAALRFLTLISLATPLFLLAARQIDEYQLSGGAVLAQDIERTALFVGLGFAAWLAVIPFHSWLTSTASESSPPTAAFVLITFPIVAISTLAHLVIDLPWLTDSQYLVTGIIIAGVVTAFVGGLLSAIQRGFGELMGYAALFNLGCIVALFGLGGRAAIVTILASLAARTLALVLMAACLSTLSILSANSGFTQVRGAAYQMPVAAGGLVAAGLTLAGAPFTAGFASSWQLIHAIVVVDARAAVLLIIGGVGVAIGYLRGLRMMLAAAPATGNRNDLSARRLSEPWPLLIFISLFILGTVFLGIFPAALIDPLQQFSVYTLFPIR